ncbi:MAG: DUF255 domain-containing protein [Saprospiraceae bacterium]|nr:DUF255 domain-containing protein [Saprospiraceae bacterium]
MRYLLFSLLLAPAVLFAQGITFEQGSWNTILAKAKSENKLIFLDAYAAWCGPCKMMTKQTFTNAEVAKYYNANFVNAKIDMEKGEGPDLADKYSVQAYPTLLFIDGDGNVVHRALGYHDADPFIELGKTANDPAKNQRNLEKRYTDGDRSPEFLKSYLAAKAANSDPNVSQIANEYLATQKDWSTEDNMEIILRFANDPSSKSFDYFADNRAKFTEKFGEDAVAEKSQTALGEYLQNNMDAPMADIQKNIGRIVGGEEGAKLSAYFPVIYYQNTGEIDLYAKAAVDYFDKFPPDNWSEWNEMAWSFYENVDDPKMLETALGWAKKSVAMEANYYNTDTLAALYYKTGKKKQALKEAKKAIELAKKSGDDYSGTEELIKKIKEKK